MKRIFSTLLLPLLLLSSCSFTSPAPEPVPVLGTGFRFSIYGTDQDPDPAYWTSVARKMARKFPGSRPMGIWIIGDIEGNQAYLNFPASSDDPNIIFGKTDDNEAALTYFDRQNVQVWLQVEPGNADMLKVIDLVLSRYGKHPCVIGFGVDVEWYKSDGSAEGTPVTDEEAILSGLEPTNDRANRVHDGRR